MDTINDSTIHKKPASRLLGIFSCCKPSRDDNARRSGSVLSHPTSLISLGDSQNRVVSSAELGLGARFTFGIPASKGRGLSFLVKDALPMESVFILGYKNKIVAKITQKKVEHAAASVFLRVSSANDLSMMSNQTRDSIEGGKQVRNEQMKGSFLGSLKKNLFGKQEKPIQAAEKNSGLIPENIASHIAKRLKCDIIIDALCGYGGTAIQFAKHCNYVIAIDSEVKRTQSAKKNAESNDVSHIVDFLTIDFLKIKTLNGDIVFLDPTDIRANKKESYSVFKHAEPELPLLLQKSFETSYKIALKLPHDVELNDISDLFHTTFEKYGLHSKRFCIEIEKISNEEGQPDSIMVYFGDCSSIELKEEYEAIYEHIFSDEDQNVKNKTPLSGVIAIIEKVGIRKSFKYLCELDETFTHDNSFGTMSRFDCFLQKIMEKNILTKEAINRLMEEGSSFLKIPSSGAYDNSYTASTLTFLKKEASPLFSSPKAMNRSRGEEDLANKKPTLKTESADNSPLLPRNEKNKIKNLLYDLNEKETLQETSPQSSYPERTDPFVFTQLSKASHEVSELAVSSYSAVNSSYLKDNSWTEDGNSYNQRKSMKPKKEENEEFGSKKGISFLNDIQFSQKDDFHFVTKQRSDSFYQDDRVEKGNDDFDLSREEREDHHKLYQVL